MEVRSTYIEQLEKDVPRGKCRRWRIWARTDAGKKSKRFRGTYTLAREEERRFAASLGGIVPNAETFGSYAEGWREWRKASGALSPNGVAKDERNVRALRRTKLDGMRMDELTPEACRDALLWLKRHPVSGDGELRNSTMQGLHVALSSILKQAADDGRIGANPMAKVKAPRPERTEREALAPEEIMLLLNRIDEQLPLDGRVVALYLMACLGLRRAEACALQVADVRDGMAHVHLAVKEHNGTVGEPKSAAGVRTLPMPGRLQEKVAEWLEFRQWLGLADSPWVACNSRGDVMRPQNLYRWWREVSPRIGCEGVVLHELRHSNLSMMARYMSPFDLQRYAGWSSIEPAKIYIHDDLDAVKAAVAGAWGLNPGTTLAPSEKKARAISL